MSLGSVLSVESVVAASKYSSPLRFIFGSILPRSFLIGGSSSIASSVNASTLGVSVSLEKWKELFGLGGSGETQDAFSSTGILKAVPKKKVSHQKRRSKLLGPGRKQIEYINHLNKCPSCGHYKRSHTVCMNCFVEVRDLWSKFMGKPARAEPLENEILSETDRSLLYSNRKELDYAKSASRTRDINERNRIRERNVVKTLPFESKKKASK